MRDRIVQSRNLASLLRGRGTDRKAGNFWEHIEVSGDIGRIRDFRRFFRASVVVRYYHNPL